MKQPIEVLFDTCKEILGKDRVHTLEQFEAECRKDSTMGEGVGAVCTAMLVYSEPLIMEIQSLRNQLQACRQTAEIEKNWYEDMIADLKKDSVIATHASA